MKPAVLILGATGTIGRGAVKAAVDAGWPVVAVARDAQALEELRRRHPRAALQILPGSVSDDAGAAELVAELQRLDRPFAGVIAALGAGGERGRLLDQSSDQLRHAFDDVVLPHLVAARHLLPWLGASGRNCGYVVIGGPGGRYPWAGYGHRSIAAAAVRMLARVLHGEARQFSVRLQLLEVESPVRTDDNEKHACEQWPCVEHIGRKALELLRHRNDARCMDAVVDYRSDACTSGEALPVESEVPRSSSSAREESGDGATRGLDESSQRDSSPKATPQEMDSDASLLPARCLQDVRNLLDTITSPKVTVKQIRSV
ncbi:NAD(P)-dependent dehydrogenase (short-subunit alcohol dehydrogenase family) [Lysobacter niabensis]|uniref:NAD(P)-dependent dehydrogenase (Short-subunit alcohol dehydrogenase family) n=1 Tax=Agrilutibacter niabensis TaxID=380628 RepID=A0ABU1VKW9_9GAMM|nr:SDR family oxidoreductase [Lysobacter niabensis]MDR7098122.1 NAD(P)-dependent dehydrogenase (short-subunit alcohol dehydrogenase family) [Lysobacter niabensis]